MWIIHIWVRVGCIYTYMKVDINSLKVILASCVYGGEGKAQTRHIFLSRRTFEVNDANVLDARVWSNKSHMRPRNLKPPHRIDAVCDGVECCFSQFRRYTHGAIPQLILIWCRGWNLCCCFFFTAFVALNKMKYCKLGNVLVGRYAYIVKLRNCVCVCNIIYVRACACCIRLFRFIYLCAETSIFFYLTR